MEDDTEKPTHPKIRMSGYKIIVHYLFLSILAPLSSKPEREREESLYSAFSFTRRKAFTVRVLLAVLR